jgi:DNA-binding NarL/FixJ family response regulator
MNDPSLHTKGPPNRQRIHVLVADKNAHFRETIRRVLARLGRCVVSGEASTVPEVISQVTASHIDLVLLDVDMVTSDRLADLKRLAKRVPDLKVAVLLSDDTPEYREAVEHHGAHFSVAKDSIEDQLPHVLKAVAGAASVRGPAPASSA